MIKQIPLYAKNKDGEDVLTAYGKSMVDAAEICSNFGPLPDWLIKRAADGGMEFINVPVKNKDSENGIKLTKIKV